MQRRVAGRSGDTDSPPLVLFVSVIGGLGGPTRSLVTVLRRLEGSVTRVLAAPPGPAVELARSSRALEGTIRLPSRRTPVAYAVAATKIAAWAVRNRRRLAVIHANGAAELHLSAPAAILTRRPVAVWAHAWQPSRWSPRLGPVWARVLPDVRFAAVSGIAVDVLAAERMADPAAVIGVPNPIDLADVAGTDVLRESSMVTVGYLGTRRPEKGFDVLVATVAASAGLPIGWLVAMDPPTDEWTPSERVLWNELTADPARVRVVGKRSAVGEVYGACDVVMCPSREESFGRIAAEAMANGLPVVASDIPAFRALVGDGEAGLLFPVGDAAAAARALGRLASDDGLRAALGRAGHARVARYEPARVARQLLELYGLS